MKHGQDQFDMAKVTITCQEGQVAGITFVTLSGNAHARVKGTMRIDGSASVKIEEPPIGYFDLGLIHNILTGPT